MQKARIITLRTESAQAVAERLRAHGYAVEIVAPGEASDPKADLEIELETCVKEQALQRAAELSQAQNADVYIGAGCFMDKETDLATEPLSAPPSIADTLVGVAAGLQNKRDLLAKALREHRVAVRAARFAERTRREQEIALRAAEQDERERLAREAELLRVTEEREKVLWQQREEAERLRVAEQERLDREHAAAQMQYMGDARLRPMRDIAETPIPAQSEWPRRKREFRAAALISALFAAMLMLGWSAASSGPVPPLPRSVVNGHPGVQQEVPFGTAIAKPIAATVPKNVRPKTTKPQADRGKVSADSKEQGKHARKINRSRARSKADDYVAEDEVRYFRRTKPTAAPDSEPPQNAKLKRYSDMQ